MTLVECIYNDSFREDLFISEPYYYYQPLIDWFIPRPELGGVAQDEAVVVVVVVVVEEVVLLLFLSLLYYYY